MTPEQMSAFVRKLRGNMSLREFAAKCGVSHTTIDNLERGIDPRTNKPPQIKMATFQKILSVNTPRISALTKSAPEPNIDALVDALIRGDFSISIVDQEDPLWRKISHLSDTDRIKAEAFIDGLLAADKYQEPTHQIKIAARGGGVKEITVTDSQLQAIKNLPEVTDLGK